MNQRLLAKDALDSLIKKSRSDLYKPIQIAEVLFRHRTVGDFDINNLPEFQNPSIHWRDAVTLRLTGKKSGSSARYQHDVWNDTAMPPSALSVLSEWNMELGGHIESYIYGCVSEKYKTINAILEFIESTPQESFKLEDLLYLFEATPGMKRSIDKAYEIVTYALLETLVVCLEAVVTISVPAERWGLLAEFDELAKKVLGVSVEAPEFSQSAHIFRVGVTNSADRGLDMWANFGPAVQVKHLTLDPNSAKAIVDQVESDCIVIVCRDADAEVIRVIADQISWGQRVRGIILQSELEHLYEKALRGSFASDMGPTLLSILRVWFEREFPLLSSIQDFLEERGYHQMPPHLVVD